MNEGYTSFSAFYPFYLGEHRHGVCRLLHVLGSTTVLTLLATSILTGHWWLLWLLPVVGYGPAWLGHFFFEKNMHFKKIGQLCSAGRDRPVATLGRIGCWWE